jgi:hypothetical protein
LERAVELGPTNIDALSDMVEYYTRAPGFLGGDDEKAARLKQRIIELQRDMAGSAAPSPDAPSAIAHTRQ